MDDRDVEHYLQQLVNAREKESSYKAVADEIERQLKETGIEYKTNMVGASWRAHW